MKEQRSKAALDKKKLVEKASSYARYVREMYAPTPASVGLLEGKENQQLSEIQAMRLAHNGNNRQPEKKRNGTADERGHIKNLRAGIPPLDPSRRPHPGLPLRKGNQGNGFSSEPEISSDLSQPQFIVRKSQAPKRPKPLAQSVAKETLKPQPPPPKDYLREMAQKREQDGGRRHPLVSGADIDRVLKS